MRRSFCEQEILRIFRLREAGLQEKLTMKKIITLLLLAVLAVTLYGCSQTKDAKDTPRQTEEIESIEVYRYEGVPAAAEKKILTEQTETADLYRQLPFADSKKDKESAAGAAVISFRVNFRDGTKEEFICPLDPSENSEKLDAIWNSISSEAKDAEPDELPILE